jgi:SWI/SNF-related matrix-associated actin-dependent regulator 1 of chromatin subfamily A
MIITFYRGIFVVDRPEFPSELKKAGFVHHEPSLCENPHKCKACRAEIGTRHWSNRVESATRLKRFCNQRALDAIADHCKKLDASRAVDSNIVVPVPAGLKLKPYQKAGVAFMLSHKDTYVGDDMGLGKTPTTLAFMNCLKPRRTLIVCPATLIFNWIDEAAKWLLNRYEIIVPRTSKDTIPDRDNILVLVSYQKTTGNTPLADSLRRHWDILICDEAHALKTYGNKRTHAVLGRLGHPDLPKDYQGLMDLSKRTEFLSGTPFENYPKEIWTIAAACCPVKFGDWWEFAKRYCGLHTETGKGGHKRLVDTGSSNLGELQQRLRATFMIRRLKSDVLKELPPKRRQLISIGQESNDWSADPDFVRWKELYETDYEAKLAALEAAKTEEEYRNAIKALDDLKIPFEKISDFRHKTAVAKLPACINYIDELLEAGLDKLVIFAYHTDVIQELIAHYGDQAVAVYGNTPMAKRGHYVKMFQEGKTRIFIGGLEAAGPGINLFAASTVVFVEGDWNPSIMMQAEDRLCRIGQKKMVHVIVPVLDGSIDANMMKRVIKKLDVIDMGLNLPPDHGVKAAA